MREDTRSSLLSSLVFGIRVPGNGAGKPGGMLVERSLTLIVLAEQPQHIVPIQDAPHGREGVAETKIDAAHPSMRDEGGGMRDEGRYKIFSSFIPRLRDPRTR